MAEITLDQIVKVYPGGVTAVDSLSLRIRDGEFMVLVGPSGCGKSTALRMIAGMEQISGGTVSIGATIVNDLPPKDRDIAMIFQNYALYPHMTVEQNMAFGLRMRKTPKREIDRRVKQAAALLGLEECLKRRPSALSGGQRQRVAMGRAIVREPKAFLMDEPLSNLDAKLRLSMRAALVQLHERLRTTTIFVTHDQVEAMTLGDRVCVMHDGQLQQVDTPQNLFDYPVNLFVASFIGSPAMNTVIARLSADDDVIAAEFAGYRLPIPRDTLRARPAVADYIGREVILGVRPSDFEDGRLTNEEWPRMQVTADVTEGLGNATHVIFTVDAPPPAGQGAAYADGQDDGVIPLAEGTSLWTARVSARSKAGPGDRMDLAVDTSRLHFFDPHSGKSIGLQQAAVTGA